MAILPDSSESFAREVDENLRRDRAAEFAKRYGALVIGAVVLLLAALAGFLYWQNRQDQAASVEGEQLAQLLGDIEAGNIASAPARLESLARSRSDGYRASALLMGAALALERDDVKGAIAGYARVAADDSLPRPYRDLAIIRRTALEFDSLAPAAVIERLKPLAEPDQPWFGSAAEMTAVALVRQKRRAEAGRLLVALASDPKVPRSIRERSIQFAGTFGADASAAIADSADPPAATPAAPR